jgi:type 1 glutamine amidotransferase
VFGVHGAGLLYMNQPGAGYNVMLGGHVRGAMVHPQQHGSKFKVAVDRPGHLLASAFEGASQKYRLVYSWLDKDVRRKYYVSFDAPAELADELYVLDPSPGGGLEALHGRTPTDGVESPVQLSRGLGTEPAGPPDGSVAGVDKETAGDRYPADVTDLAFALLWTKRDGKGRVAYTQLGHNFAVYSVPCVARMMLESVMYVAGGEKQ